MRSELESFHLAKAPHFFNGIFIDLIQNISSFVLVPEGGWFSEDKEKPDGFFPFPQLSINRIYRVHGGHHRFLICLMMWLYFQTQMQKYKGNPLLLVDSCQYYMYCTLDLRISAHK